VSIESETTSSCRNGIAKTLLQWFAILIALYLWTTRIETAEEGRAVVFYAISQSPLTCTEENEIACSCCCIINCVETIGLVTPEFAKTTALLDTEVFVLRDG
jgi:hypothetical protein